LLTIADTDLDPDALIIRNLNCILLRLLLRQKMIERRLMPILV